VLRRSGLTTFISLCGLIGLATTASAGRKHDDSKSYIHSGTAAMDKGDLDAAIEAYGRSVALAPKSAVANYNRGSALQMKGDLEGALADYNLAISLDPGHSEVFMNRGNVRQTMGDLVGAMKDYDRSLRLSSRSPKTWYNRDFSGCSWTNPIGQSTT
jgi:tetratricopeptide (TPR) repeat protein